MRIARTLAALLFVLSLSFSCTADELNEDTDLLTIEETHANGDDTPPPTGGGNGNG